MSITDVRKSGGKMLIAVILILVILIALSIPHEEKKKLTIYHAGSLSNYFSMVEKKYENIKEDVDIKRNVGGSNYLYRQIVDLNKKPNIYASADATLIDLLVEKNFARYSIRFATTRMVIAYTSNSKYSEEINEKNWHEILIKEDVLVGISNPNLDPCGYRACMVVLLAENYYNKSLFENVIPSESGIKKKDNESIICNSYIRKSEKLFIRPKMVELFSYLEHGEIDYIFTYECEAKVKTKEGIKYISLPDDINLGNYSIKYNISVTLFSGEEKEMKIESKVIEYGITSIQENDISISFLKFVLSDTEDLLYDAGFSPIKPPICNQWKNLPNDLKEVVKHQ